jgi:predicted MFS family arabinose efflux permease
MIAQPAPAFQPALFGPRAQVAGVNQPVPDDLVPLSAPARRSRLRLLQLATFTSSCDRFAIAPLLFVIAADLGVSLGATAVVASAYYLAYGLMQPVWGVLSDRIGRVRSMRLSLLGAATAGLAAALAPNLAALTVARAATGGFFSAVIPASLVYVGDTWPSEVRQRPLSDLLAATALGTGLATLGAGLAADLLGWRAALALTALAGGALWVALGRLPEPAWSPATRGPLALLAGVLGHRWALLVLALVSVEGAVVLGLLTYLAPALQERGAPAALAGLVAAAYGIGALAWSRLVKALVGRLGPARLAAVGGGLLLLGWAAPAVAVTPATALVAGLLVGGAWAFMHSTLQDWATQVTPWARATAVSLFAAALFLGSAAGTALAAPLADAGAFGSIFGAGAVAAVPLTAAVTLGRHRYPGA